MSKYKEACPVCGARVEWEYGEDDGRDVTCAECHVPLVIIVPFFKTTDSGYLLRVSPKAMATLREAYKA